MNPSKSTPEAEERQVVLDEFVASCEVAEHPEIEKHVLGVVAQLRRGAA